MQLFLTVIKRRNSFQPSLHVVFCGPEMTDLLQDGTALSSWLDFTTLSFMACQLRHIHRGAVLCIQLRVGKYHM